MWRFTIKAIATTFELVSTIPYGENLTTTVLAGYGVLHQRGHGNFVIVFGTRDIDASEQHPGMILAIAFESVIKLAALLILGFGWSARCTARPPIFSSWRNCNFRSTLFHSLLFRCPLFCKRFSWAFLLCYQGNFRLPLLKTIKPNTFKQHAGYFRFI